MPFDYEEFDLSGVRTYPLASRTSKAHVEDFARPVTAGGSFKEWFDSLPAILGARDLRRVVSAIVDAKRRDGGIIWGLGAHVIKTGVSPVLIDLMERGYVSALAMNGAGIIHDFEIALSGATSEDVDEALGPGRFGMAEETGRLLNEAIRRGAERKMGLGQAVAHFLAGLHAPHAGCSLAATAHRFGIPVTVHVAIGTDIIHMHPAASGAAIGDTSLRDFRYFTSAVARLKGGVYLNCGSAVDAARGVPQGRGARPQPGRRPRRADDGQHRFPADVPAADERRDAAGRGHQRRRDFAGRPPRDPDSADRGRRDQSG